MKLMEGRLNQPVHSINFRITMEYTEFQIKAVDHALQHRYGHRPTDE